MVGKYDRAECYVSMVEYPLTINSSDYHTGITMCDTTRCVARCTEKHLNHHLDKPPVAGS